MRRPFAPLLVSALSCAAIFAGAGLAVAQPPASGGADAAVPCEEADATLSARSGTDRLRIARAVLTGECRPMPASLHAAIFEGIWNGDTAPSPDERTQLLALAARHGYDEAESLAVAIVENGRWPDGPGIDLEQGAVLVRSLQDAMDPYRTRLLLDVYDQHADPGVRVAVLEALRRSESPEALLAALDAFTRPPGPVREAALATITAQPEGSAAGVLARIVRTLPDGPLLDWAARLSTQIPGPAVDEALRARGR